MENCVVRIDKHKILSRVFWKQNLCVVSIINHNTIINLIPLRKHNTDCIMIQLLIFLHTIVLLFYLNYFTNQIKWIKAAWQFPVVTTDLIYNALNIAGLRN